MNRFLGRFISYLKITPVKNSIASLDGLRGFAMIWVLLRHCFRSRTYEDNYVPVLNIRGWEMCSFFLNGFIALDLFFVLSGFLMMMQLDRNKFHLKKFFISRIFRILPPYYAVLIILYIGILPYEFLQNDLNIRFFYHFLFLQDYLPSDIVPAFWSLAVEEKFYFMSPIIYKLLNSEWRKKIKMRIFLSLLLLSPYFLKAVLFEEYLLEGKSLTYQVFFEKFRSPFHMNIQILFLGSVVYFIYKEYKKRDIPRTYLYVIFYAGLSLILPFALSSIILKDVTSFTILSTSILIPIGCALILLSLCLGDTVIFTKITHSRILFFFGRVSYSMYLTHMIFMNFSWQLTGSICVLVQLDMSKLSLLNQFLLYIPIYFALCIGSGLLLYYMVEKPFLLLRERLL